MSKKPAKGEEIGIRRLTGLYDQYILIVLRNRLQQLPTKRGKPRMFRVIEELPDLDEYRRVRDERYTTTVEALVDEAFSDAQSVGEELREWYDNMPENFQSGDRGCAIDEAASNCENLDQPTMPGNVGSGEPLDLYEFDIRSVPVLFLPSLNCNSRSIRLSEAASQLQTVVDLFRDAERGDERFPTGVWDKDGELHQDIASWLDELENQINELEHIEVPGMYG